MHLYIYKYIYVRKRNFFSKQQIYICLLFMRRILTKLKQQIES